MFADSPEAVPSVAQVLRNAPDRDPRLTRQPDPAVCGCGAWFEWTVYPPAGHRHEGKLSPRWVAPPINPCAACAKANEAAEAERALWARQRAALIGERDRYWRWERAEVQGRDESISDFADRVKAHATPTIGVQRQHVKIAQEVASWTPRSGFSIYLAGAPGTGKTLFACALATRLLVGSERRVAELGFDDLERIFGEDKLVSLQKLGRDKTFVGGHCWPVLVCAQTELDERMRLAWQRDKAPLAQVAAIDALILDDLGEVGSDPLTGDKQPPGAADAISRLIRRRYVDGRHLVITSNIPFEPITRNGRVVVSGIRDWYGDRVYDRLREMCAGHIHSLGEWSWRQREPVRWRGAT